MIKKLLVGGVTLCIISTSMVAFSAEISSNIENRIERLERMADNPVLLRLSQQLSQQQRDISSLHDDVDRLKHQLRQANERNSRQYLDVDSRLSVLEETPLSRQIMPSVETPAKEASQNLNLVDTEEIQEPLVVSEVIQTHPATDEEREIYRKAFDLLKQKKYQEAIDAFKAFKNTFPKSSLASNSAYWAGEGLLILGEQEKAIDFFAMVQKHYPTSSKAPDSLLRQADTLQNINKTQQAKELYQQLIKQHPEDRAAKKAASRLKELKQ